MFLFFNYALDMSFVHLFVAVADSICLRGQQVEIGAVTIIQTRFHLLFVIVYSTSLCFTKNHSVEEKQYQ